jgi:membrane protease YdiL (CAAX protease family)
MVIASSFLLEFNHSIDFSFLGEHTMSLIKDNQQMMDRLHYSFIGTTNQSLIFNFFLMAMLPAVCEEIVFRGVLQYLFTKWSKNIHLGILLSALVFALLHFQFYNIIPLLLLGTLLGYTMAMTKNIWSTILLHFAYNSFSIVSIYCEKKEIQLDQVINLDISYFNLIGLLISILLLFLIWRKNNHFMKTKQNYLA